jgi:hypothetical protein
LSIGVSLAAACGSSDSSSGGSCTLPDGTSTSMMCEQAQEPEALSSTMCRAFGGTWSSSACDASKYARKCEDTAEMTSGGKTTTVHYTYYYTAASTTVCLGTETKL